MNPYETRESDDGDDRVRRIESKIDAAVGLAFLCGIFFAVFSVLIVALLERIVGNR